MSKQKFIFAVLTIVLLSSCAPVRPPVPPGVVPKPRLLTTAEEQYGHEVLAGLTEKYELDYNDPRLDTITKIVDKLTHAAGADQSPWHVYLFREPTIKNAAATRGNHVFIWSGMLDLAKSEEEIATILSHEIGHVLAGHTDPDPQEEVKKLIINVGAMAAGIAASHAGRSQNYGDLAASLTQELGHGLLVNPHSRELELEADHIGLFMMADAKYNPQAAIDFWTRAQSIPDFRSSFDFFSTHPPPEDRLDQLRRLLPVALERYSGRSTNQSSTTGQFATGDSFDWRATPTAPTHAPDRTQSVPDPGFRDQAPPNPQRTNDEHSWRVFRDRAILFDQPNMKSRPLGEFRRGATVLAISGRGGWIEIQHPDHGFMRLEDLEPSRTR